MWVKLQRMKQELQSMLTGWLVVALLAPMLLGLMPERHLSPAEAYLHDAEMALCTKADPLSQSRDQHKSHNDDCPCCLPGGLASHAAPAPATALEPAFTAPHFVALVPLEWATPARLPHDRKLALQTGPPKFFQA